MQNRRWLGAFSVVLCALAACSSQQSSFNAVMEPVDDKASLSQEAVNPIYVRLAETLKTLGYEPVGIQYESNAVLELWNQVFLDPKTHNRMISLLYTGLQMSYDKTAHSLTIGGLTNSSMIVAYIQRNVPLKPHVPVKAPPFKTPVIKSLSPPPKSVTPQENVAPIPSASPLLPAEPVTEPPAASPTPSSPAMESAVPSPTPAPVELMEEDPVFQ